MHLTISSAATSATAALVFAVQVTAFWRMPCRGRTGVARIDPLISPGSVAEHAHVIHGSSGFSESATYDDLRGADCTSCSVTQDKSAYWTPALYFQDASTGEYELVQQDGGMLAYYFLYPNANGTSQNVTAFPDGFRMIAGDTYQRNFTYPVPDAPKSDWSSNASYIDQAFLRQAAIGFNCLHYLEAPESSLYRHTLPDKAWTDANCPDGVRFELMFPSCWNGVDKDSDDHKSHVVYPSEVMTGNCPPGFETRLNSLFYETIWKTNYFPGRDGQFVISNGDTTGCGYHGDFMMGWDSDFLQQATDQCTNGSGEIEDCALFTIQDSTVYDSCNITEPAALKSDNVVGPVNILPGDVAIKAGPAYAKSGASDSDSGSDAKVAVSVAAVSSAEPTPTPTPSAAPSGSDAPGAVFAAADSSSFTEPTSTPSPSPAPAATPSPATTAAPEVSAAAVPAEDFFSTQYLTTGETVSEILWVEELVTVTRPYTATTTTTVDGAAARKRRHMHQHQHLH